jgi:hypothetical protein
MEISSRSQEARDHTLTGISIGAGKASLPSDKLQARAFRASPASVVIGASLAIVKR